MTRDHTGALWARRVQVKRRVGGCNGETTARRGQPVGTNECGRTEYQTDKAVEGWTECCTEHTTHGGSQKEKREI